MITIFKKSLLYSTLMYKLNRRPYMVNFFEFSTFQYIFAVRKHVLPTTDHWLKISNERKKRISVYEMDVSICVSLNMRNENVRSFLVSFVKKMKKFNHIAPVVL